MIPCFEFIKRLLRSHLGHVLLTAGWCFIFFVMVRPSINQPQFVGCVPSKDEIYWLSDILPSAQVWVKAVAAAHVPAILVTIIASKALQWLFSLSCYPTAKVELTI